MLHNCLPFFVAEFHRGSHLKHFTICPRHLGACLHSKTQRRLSGAYFSLSNWVRAQLAFDYTKRTRDRLHQHAQLMETLKLEFDNKWT